GRVARHGPYPAHERRAVHAAGDGVADPDVAKREERRGALEDPFADEGRWIWRGLGGRGCGRRRGRWRRGRVRAARIAGERRDRRAKDGLEHGPRRLRCRGAKHEDAVRLAREEVAREDVQTVVRRLVLEDGETCDAAELPRPATAPIEIEDVRPDARDADRDQRARVRDETARDR